MEVYFAVEGGFANQIRSISIAPDGSAVVEVSGRTAEGQVEAATVAEIVAELDRSGLFDRDRTYDVEGGADLQRYELRYAGHTIVAYDTTVPPELDTAIAMLEAAIRSR